MNEHKLTKKDIITNIHTSVLPACNTEELNKFYQDTATVFDLLWVHADGKEVGIVYKNLSNAMKAYQKYGFTDAEILKIKPKHEEIKLNSIKVKNSPDDHMFVGFRNKVPFNKPTRTLMK